jgi:alcohol dehydrogenase YqhD (iron-dependent ADH family)
MMFEPIPNPESALDALGCTVTWEGEILPNPEYDRLMEIVSVVKSQQPDLLLAVGGGSVLDGTKFISVAAKLDDAIDARSVLFLTHEYPATKFDVGAVITIPATGSEWNYNFVISCRSIQAKLNFGEQKTFRIFTSRSGIYNDPAGTTASKWCL